ncbi:MAG: BACON domain-containing protein [Fermentimonas sp.]|jgi:hypothetical protein
MKKIYSILIATVGVVLVMLSMYSCRDDFFDRIVPGTDDSQTQVDADGKVSVTMRIKVPGIMNASTRAATALKPDDESKFTKETARLMIFSSNTSGTPDANLPENMIYVEDATIESVNPGSQSTQMGDINFKANTGKNLNFVLFVNSSEAMAFKATEGKTTKAEVINSLKFSVDNDTDFSGGLPMWGEVYGVNIGENSNIETSTIWLLRAVARVDVGLNMTAFAPTGTALDNDFDESSQKLTSTIVDANGKDVEVTWTLKGVTLYNATQKGLIVPGSDNYSTSEEEAIKGKTKATAPTLPADLVKQDLTYTAENNILKRIIYVPEVDNPEASDEVNADYVKDRPYLILNLSYKSEDGSVNGESFFRVDFIKKEGDTYKYMPLLRNYRYKVDIRDIGDLGYDNEEDAKKAPAANINYVVTQWEESMMSNVQYDGQYMLAVSQDTITFDGAGGTYDIKVQTSWPGGFEIKPYEVKENASSWVTTEVKPTDPEKTGETDEKTVTFTAPAEAVDREGKVVIQAGRMKWIVNVIQKKEINYEIGIYEDEECKIPRSFVEINEYGEAYDEKNPAKSIHTKDGDVLTPEQAVAYKYFYVKSKPQNAEVFMVTPENPDNPFKVTLEETLSGGVQKYKVTARDITGDIKTGDIPFETFDATYMFAFEKNVSPEDDVDSEGRPIAKISFLQKEYDALPYSDKELQELLLDEKSDNMYLMDGNEHAFYVKANTPYKIKLLSLKAYDGSKKGLKDTDPDSVMVSSPLLKGRPYTFETVDDMSDPSVYHAIATYEISSPYGFFPKRVFDIELVSAIKQPEANTYMIKAGAKQGILIPVSSVNTAYQYYRELLMHDEVETRDNFKLPGTISDFMLNYLDDDDAIVPEVLWTDIHNKKYLTNGEVKGDNLKLSGLEHLKVIVGKDGKRYIHVHAGDMPGNILISIQSSKINRQPTIWSWHIWIVDDYPKVLEIDSPKGKPGVAFVPDGLPTVNLMSHLIGAEEAPNDTYDYKDYNTTASAYKVYGMQYQWGRKDPFPSFGLYAEKQFYTGDGQPFDFHRASKGTRNNIGETNTTLVTAAGATYTMKASIENPHRIVSHQTFWQYELFPFQKTDWFSNKWTFLYLWNKVIPENQSDPEKVGGKTVFDPSPYGFRIMSQAEATTLRFAYYWSDKYTPKFCTPLPGAIYDGYYLHRQTGGGHAIFAVSQGRKGTHAGRYLVNTTGGREGWASGSNTNNSYRRALTVSVRPVIDPDVTEDYTNYWPDYKLKLSTH